MFYFFFFFVGLVDSVWFVVLWWCIVLLLGFSFPSYKCSSQQSGFSSILDTCHLVLRLFSDSSWFQMPWRGVYSNVNYYYCYCICYSTVLLPYATWGLHLSSFGICIMLKSCQPFFSLVKAVLEPSLRVEKTIIFFLSLFLFDSHSISIISHRAWFCSWVKGQSFLMILC